MNNSGYNIEAEAMGQQISFKKEGIIDYISNIIFEGIC